ncbi:MAG TPA: cobamide remodeling phosphodiesterase CbiR [Sphaerochaeta sp.]|nr:cobamide remodeling phosphodiesterase CbiR [Sphaerochaeta sp.]
MRIGTTSYIIPDDILPNVRYLAPLVDDIELVLFESEGEDNLPSKGVIQSLNELAKEHDLTYTVHFPLDVYPGSTDEKVRTKTLDTYLKILDLTQELDPFAYILHLTPDQYGETASNDIPTWLSHLDESMSRLLEKTSLPSQMFCAETLSYPFELVQPLVEKHGLAVTLDIGHVWMMGYDAQQSCTSLLSNTRVCHLHGVDEKAQDHQSLAKGNPLLIERFLTSLVEQEQDGKERVLTLEVFSQDDFLTSLSLLRQSRAMMGKREESKLWQQSI